MVAAVTHIVTSRYARAMDRASLVRQYSAEFAHDREVIKLFVDIDHEEFRFDPAMASWLGEQPEITVVRMLDLFNSLGHSWSRGLIKLADIHGTTLGYAIVRTHNDPYIRKYIAHVDGHSFEHVGTDAAFEFFRRLAVQLDEKSSHIPERSGRASGSRGAERRRPRDRAAQRGQDLLQGGHGFRGDRSWGRGITVERLLHGSACGLEERLESRGIDEDVEVGNVRGYAESVLSSGRKVEHPAGFDELRLAVAPSLEGTVEHDERFRLSVVKMARAHAAKLSALLDKRKDSPGCRSVDRDSAEIAKMFHDGKSGCLHVHEG